MSLSRSLRQARATSLGDLFLLCCLKLALMSGGAEKKESKTRKRSVAVCPGLLEAGPCLPAEGSLSVKLRA